MSDNGFLMIDGNEAAAHVAYRVNDIAHWRAKLEQAGCVILDSLPIPGHDRFETRDPFGNTAFMSYDVYDLLVRQSTDPVGNRVTADHDYRLLQTFRVTDPNGNRAEVAFDEWFTEALATTEVTVDPRYGTWDAAQASVVRPVPATGAVITDSGEG